MLKLSLLIEGKDSPVKPYEKKFIDFLEGRFEPMATVDQIYYDVHYGMNIMEMLTKDYVIPFDIALEIYYLYNNNLPKIRRGDDSWLDNPIRGYEEESSEEQMVLSKHLQIPPNFLSDEHSYYGMTQFINEDDGHVYAIGADQDVEDAVKETVENILYPNEGKVSVNDVLDTEVTWQYGENFIMDFIEIAEWAIYDISKEEANREIEEWYENDPESMLTQVIKTRPDIEKQWGDLLGRRGDLEDQMFDTDNENEADLLKDKIDEIDEAIEEMSELASEEIIELTFINNKKWMKDDPLDWLLEFGYVEKYGNTYELAKLDVDSKGRKKDHPNWILVDTDKIREKLVRTIGDYRAEEFAKYDGVERVEKYNGTTYYIYKTE